MTTNAAAITNYPVITRSQARRIISAAIEELQVVADDHPKISASILAVRQMLEDALKLDAAIYDDARAVHYFGTVLRQAAAVLRLPIRMKMAVSHHKLIESTQIDLEQSAAILLGEKAPEPAEPKTFERLTPADLHTDRCLPGLHPLHEPKSC